MLRVGDEVCTCSVSFLTDRWGRHLHTDECFEVRTVLDYRHDVGCLVISDLVSGTPKLVYDHMCRLSTLSLRLRKTDHFYLVRELIEDTAHADEAEAPHILARVLGIVDRYLMATPSTFEGDGDAGPQDARNRFELIAITALNHRRDRGLRLLPAALLRQIRKTAIEGPARPVVVPSEGQKEAPPRYI